ncbi:hypothetical protein V1519DRAFT_433662 [Lipomyces tetrasporus]
MTPGLKPSSSFITPHACELQIEPPPSNTQMKWTKKMFSEAKILSTNIHKEDTCRTKAGAQMAEIRGVGFSNKAGWM